jgi:hypothetical protein
MTNQQEPKKSYKGEFRCLQFSLLIMIFVNLYLFLQRCDDKYVNQQSLRKGNEQIYEELTKSTNLILFNTDLMMRFSHYQNNHNPEVKQEKLCPECSSPDRIEQEIDPAWIDLPEDEETVYQLEDAVFDNKEILTQIQRLTGSLTNQHHKLKYTLLKMKYGNSDEEELQEDKPQRRHVNPNSILATFEQKLQDKDGTDGLGDFCEAIESNIRPDLHTKLAPLVAASRYAENGAEGREYGILHPDVDPTYRSQAGWCAATVQKNWDRYEQHGGDTENIQEYINFLGNVYCPLDDSRDITGLNQYWQKNVTTFYEDFSE